MKLIKSFLKMKSYWTLYFQKLFICFVGLEGLLLCDCFMFTNGILQTTSLGIIWMLTLMGLLEYIHMLSIPLFKSCGSPDTTVLIYKDGSPKSGSTLKYFYQTSQKCTCTKRRPEITDNHYKRSPEFSLFSLFNRFSTGSSMNSPQEENKKESCSWEGKRIDSRDWRNAISLLKGTLFLAAVSRQVMPGNKSLTR